jgi:hypothetical protein
MPPRPRAASAAPAEAEPTHVPLPEVEADPDSYLGPAALEVDFAEQTWHVPALTAADWLAVLWADPFNPDSIFPGLVDDIDLDDVITELIFSGELDGDEVFDTAMEILEAHSGYRWWFALRLSILTKAAWARIGGVLVLSGVDPRSVTLGSWLSAVLAIIAERSGGGKEFAQLLDKLNEAPEGYGPSLEEQMVMDEAAFLSAMNAPY